jgi:uncharacterized membrane protein
MEISQLLARIIGPYMMVAGIALIINRGNMKKMFDEYQHNNMLTFSIGALVLLLGLLLLQFHNLWTADWRVLVTIIAWITTIKGVAAMIFPDALMKIAELYKDNDGLLNIQAGIAVLFGAFMSYMGYFT